MIEVISMWLSRICRRGFPTRDIQVASVDSERIAGFVRVGALLVVVGLLVGILAAQPVAAQAENPVCAGESGTLPNMIEGFVQLTTALGLMGLLVIWQADELAQMATMKPEQTRALKQHKRGAMKSAAVLVLLGPLFTIAGQLMQLPVADCVNLVPF